jgi:Flp pilus assembly protein TadD
MAKLPSQEAAALAFAEVMVAVEWLHRRGGPELLGKILARIRGDIPMEKAFHESGLDFDHFLSEWKRYMAARPLPAGGDVEARKLRFADDPRGGAQEYAEWAELPDDRARRHARLGEIMRERGRWGAARIEYGKAMQRVGPRFPVLTSKFALAALLSGREAEAEPALLEAARVHPHYAALHVNLGRIRAKRQDWKGAREAFLLANRVDPFDPEIHAGLASAAEAQGDAAIAARERRFAQLLATRGPVRAPHGGGGAPSGPVASDAAPPAAGGSPHPPMDGAPRPPAGGNRLHGGTPPPMPPQGTPLHGPHPPGNSPH